VEHWEPRAWRRFPGDARCPKHARRVTLDFANSLIGPRTADRVETRKRRKKAVSLAVYGGPKVLRLVEIEVPHASAGHVLSRLAAKPAELSVAEAAGYPVPVKTAIRVLNHVETPPGEPLLVHGTTGVVGSAVLQITPQPVQPGAPIGVLTNGNRRSSVMLSQVHLILVESSEYRPVFR